MSPTSRYQETLPWQTQTCHLASGCRRHPGNINQPPPYFLHSTLSMKALIFIHLVKRVLIIFQIRKEIEFSGIQAWIWLSP